MPAFRRAALLGAVMLAACAHKNDAGSATAPPAPRVDLDEVKALHDAGKIEEALAKLRAADPSDAPARALAAVLQNRPADALTLPARGDARFWEARARAAWRLGDVAALEHAVPQLDRMAKFAPELGAFLALGRAAKDRRLRQVAADRPRPATFDPKHRVPIIEVQVQGTTMRFAFDTGAELTVLDEKIADRAGARRLEDVTASAEANNGVVETPLALLESMELLGLELREVPVALADLSGFPPELGVAGIVGVADIFSSYVIRIDYRAGEITRSTGSSAEGWPLVFINGTNTVGTGGRIEGGPEGLFLVDTGGRRSTLTDAYVDRAVKEGASWKVSAPEEVEVRGLGVAQRRRRFVESARYCPAGAQAQQQDVCIPLSKVPVDTTAADASFGQAGKLGADAFVGRVLELDFPACRLRLSP